MSNSDATANAGTEVMAKAEDLATVEAEINLAGTMLIGLVGKTDAPTALLRNSDGSIDRAARGDTVKAGTVIGIDRTSVRLQKAGRVIVLNLPKG